MTAAANGIVCAAMNELRDLRRAIGLGQREFAALLSIPLETFRPWDSGRRIAYCPSSTLTTTEDLRRQSTPLRMKYGRVLLQLLMQNSCRSCSASSWRKRRAGWRLTASSARRTLARSMSCARRRSSVVSCARYANSSFGPCSICARSCARTPARRITSNCTSSRFARTAR